MVPDKVEDGLHVSHTTRDGDHRILRGQHDAILSEGSIAPIGTVPATPELVAVALVPIALRVAAVRGLPRGRRLDPLLGHQLLPLPLALLQAELAKARNVLGVDTQAVTAGRDSLRTGFPSRVVDAQRLKESRLQVIEDSRSGHLLDNR